ncbi:MAG: TonB-dependent receptor plug domain-containing protein [Cypionkella sp.]
MTSLRNRSRLAVLLGQTALIACNLPQLAMAQTTTDLEPIVVAGTGEGTATGQVKSANPATLTGTKTATPITEVPQSVSVISAETLAATNAATATGVYQDGLQHYSYGFGGFFVDPLQIERIEVLKGLSSVLYGSSNTGGGLLNYVTKRPTGENSREVEVGVDNFGRAWASYD